MECYRTVVPEPKEASGRRSLARSIKRELCDASDAAATQSTHVPFAAAHLKSEPIELLPQSYSYVLTAGFDVYPQIVYAQEIPAQRSEPDCRCIIDMSTPASLERDFYAWLNVGLYGLGTVFMAFADSAVLGRNSQCFTKHAMRIRIYQLWRSNGLSGKYDLVLGIHLILLVVRGLGCRSKPHSDVEQHVLSGVFHGIDLSGHRTQTAHASETKRRQRQPMEKRFACI